MSRSGEPCCRSSLSTRWRHLSCLGRIRLVLDVSCALLLETKGWYVVCISAHVLVSSTYTWAKQSIYRLQRSTLRWVLAVFSFWSVINARVSPPTISAVSIDSHIQQNECAFQSETSVTWIKNIGVGFFLSTVVHSVSTRVLRTAGRHHVCFSSVFGTEQLQLGT